MQLAISQSPQSPHSSNSVRQPKFKASSETQDKLLVMSPENRSHTSNMQGPRVNIPIPTGKSVRTARKDGTRTAWKPSRPTLNPTTPCLSVETRCHNVSSQGLGSPTPWPCHVQPTWVGPTHCLWLCSADVPCSWIPCRGFILTLHASTLGG
jgi:hypothetical protein